MQNTIVEEKKTDPQPIVAPTVVAGQSVAPGEKTVDAPVTPGADEVPTRFFEAAEAAVTEVALAGEQVGLDVKEAIVPAASRSAEPPVVAETPAVAESA